MGVPLMEAVTRVEGLAAGLDRPDVDTDQIIPKQFLKRIERTGYGQFLFYDWRFTDDGNPDPGFPLNLPHVQGARVLVAGRNFGCGSSREHACWALKDYGFHAVIAPSLADIFRNNCFQNGMVPVVLDEGAVGEVLARIASGEAVRLTVDVEALTVADELGVLGVFELDPFRRECLLNGWDDIGLTLRQEEAIAEYERARGLTAS